MDLFGSKPVDNSPAGQRNNLVRQIESECVEHAGRYKNGDRNRVIEALCIESGGVENYKDNLITKYNEGQTKRNEGHGLPPSAVKKGGAGRSMGE
jgi:hypothetical protein